MKIHLICDPGWSTGSIAKDLIALMPHRNMVIHPWQNYSEFPKDDLLICFSLTSAARWPSTRIPNAIHLCCHPHESVLPEFAAHLRTGGNEFYAGVSRGCRDALRQVMPRSYVHLLPASARANRFERRPRPNKRIAGFIGRPQATGIQITGGIKQPEWFNQLCQEHGLTPHFTHQNYSYETMQEFYDSVDYLFCTSSSEGGPLGPFEAALCGVPVISTPVGFWGECNMGGYFLDSADVGRHLSDLSLADEQHMKMQSVCMEALMPVWNAAIDVVSCNR